ncbi:DUF1566 domain-containing protein [Burkholderia sp. JPY481]
MQQIQLPPLAEGEIYLGGFVDSNGDVTHTILLPGDNADASWQAQMDWAKSIGGDLPTRVELALAYAKHRDKFERDWYWSNEKEGSGWAWCQDFSDGDQGYGAPSGEFRARALRRLSI